MKLVSETEWQSDFPVAALIENALHTLPPADEIRVAIVRNEREGQLLQELLMLSEQYDRVKEMRVLKNALKPKRRMKADA